MGDKVFINGRAAIHVGSAGKSIAFPDVSLCPPPPPSGPIPTPLPNTAQAMDLQGGASTVTIEGNPIAHAKSFIGKSTGNEVASSTGGDVITHVVQGKAYFQTFSMDVFIESQSAVRHMDLVTQNHMAMMPGNTPPTPWMSAMTAGGTTAPKEVEKSANEGKDWLEIVLCDPDGDPVPGAHYRVTTPKGKILQGLTLAKGSAKFKLLAKGKCKVEWLDDVAEIAKDGKTILSGSPATDHVSTGASYPYVLKLKKVRIRVLDRSEEPCKNVTCDVWIRPFTKSRHKTDGKGWLALWSPPKAKHADFKIVSPYQAEKRRVYLQPLPDDDKVASKQRLHNLGFFGDDEAGEDERMFRRAYGVDESEDLAKYLADVEANDKTADDRKGLRS